MKKWALVVDDDVLVREILPALLKGISTMQRRRRALRRALEMIAQQRFDVVFTDYEMPGMNGIELTRVVREMSPHSIVILMTGLAAPDLFRSSGAMASSRSRSRSMTCGPSLEMQRGAAGQMELP